MKRIIATLALLFAGFFAGALFVGIPVGAGGQGEPVEPPSTGDTNGDQIIDVSDAVYLLRHLFQGGPEPVACADSPGLEARVTELEAALLELAERVTTNTVDIDSNHSRVSHLEVPGCTDSEASNFDAQAKLIRKLADDLPHALEFNAFL